jgi:hypothetical protein
VSLHSLPFRSIGLAVLVVLAGCAGAPIAGDRPGTADDGAGDRGTGWAWPDDPPRDVLGWEAGYWHNESIAVNQSDGLDPAEREAFVARTMARVEYIREREFTEPVPVEVVSRAEYREQNVFRAPDSAWAEQQWEALFLIDEETSVSETFSTLYGSNVLGYYSPSEDRIVVVSDSPTPAMDRATLAHELVHALQDQVFGLPPGQPTRDGSLARNGIVEGDARYVELLYERRCADGEWDCVPTPDRESSGPAPNRGVLLTVLQPYADGPTLVHELRQRGGWDAVDAAYETLPASTEQTIHPERYPDEEPRTVRVPDRSNGAWRPIDHDPATETLGEASIYAMFWANHIVRDEELTTGTGRFSYYNYSHPRSDGWAGDAFVAYTNGSDGRHGYGYVWATEWDSEAEAEQFRSSYVLLLKLRHGAALVDGTDDVYEVTEGPYADAFRVTRTGDRVVIVNAPRVADLVRVHRP